MRLLHLDLLVILGLGLSLFFFNRAEITASVALYYPVLGYLLVADAARRPAPARAPGAAGAVRADASWLAAGVVVLALGRIVLNVVDSQVIDIGVAGVIGADRIGDGAALYDGAFSPGIDLRGDVYGPANYLAYLPFELIFGWDGVWDDVPAAHAACDRVRPPLRRRARRSRAPAARRATRGGRSAGRSDSPGSPARGRSTR